MNTVSSKVPDGLKAKELNVLMASTLNLES